MTVRSFYISKDSYPYFEEMQAEIDWFGGFAPSQKRKNELEMRMNILAAYPERKHLEVSSASLDPAGRQLYAIVLKKQTARGTATVESAFQSSRIYRDGNEQIGPFPEYLFLPGKECKKLVKEASHGLISFEYEFDSHRFPAPDFHVSLFYDYLYLNALLEEENREQREALLAGGYDTFSDLSTRAINCQARSCAIFKGLSDAGLLDRVREPDSYFALFRVGKDGKSVGPESYENVQLLTPAGTPRLFSPVLPCRFGKAEAEYTYKRYYSHLTNKKSDDGFRRPGVFDVLPEEGEIEVCGVQTGFCKGEPTFVLVRTLRGAVRIPPAVMPKPMRDSLPIGPRVRVIKAGTSLISVTEAAANCIAPELNETHADVIEKLAELLPPRGIVY